MRLGFWNRLAVVLGAVWTIAFPTWWIVSTNARHSEIMGSGYRTCLDAAIQRGDGNGEPICFDTWLAPTTGYIKWAAWPEAAMWSALAAVAVYLVIWGVVAVVRWVWRGRSLAHD